RRVAEVGEVGGGDAMRDHMQALQAAGFEVSFLALDDRRKESNALRSLGVTPLSLPSSGSFIDVGRAHAGMFDLVYLHRVENVTRCLKVARRYFDAHIVYSVADLHHLRLKTQSEFEPERAAELMCQAQIFALHA